MGMSLALNLEEFVRITNHSSERIWGRYDGHDYEWAPEGEEGCYQDVHVLVATHIFGYLPPGAQLTPERVEDIRTRAFQRLGWLGLPEQSMASALGKLRQITIGPLPQAPNVRVLRPQDEYRPPTIEMVEADTEPAPRVAPGTPAGAGDGHSVTVPEVSPEPARARKGQAK